jgi:putative membrane protein
VILYLYHFSLHVIYREQQKDIFRFSSQKLRVWNEVATLLLFAIIFLATVKQAMSWIFGFIGLASLAIVLMLGIRIYKKMRTKR